MVDTSLLPSRVVKLFGQLLRLLLFGCFWMLAARLADDEEEPDSPLLSCKAGLQERVTILIEPPDESHWWTLAHFSVSLPGRTRGLQNDVPHLDSGLTDVKCSETTLESQNCNYSCTCCTWHRRVSWQKKPLDTQTFSFTTNIPHHGWYNVPQSQSTPPSCKTWKIWFVSLLLLPKNKFRKPSL